MEKNNENPDLPGRIASGKEKKNLQGYPPYPENEDIYNKYQEEKDINPEDISESKLPNGNNEVGATKGDDFTVDDSGRDLDIPGSELDDKMEDIGNEDEENNYYSTGGNADTDLEEDQGG